MALAAMLGGSLGVVGGLAVRLNLQLICVSLSVQDCICAVDGDTFASLECETNRRGQGSLEPQKLPRLSRS